MNDRSDDPSNHERTFLQRSYISLPPCISLAANISIVVYDILFGGMLPGCPVLKATDVIMYALLPLFCA